MFSRKFLKNNSIFITGTLLSGFLGYLFHFVVSRQISVAQYGELQSLLSISIIFGVFNSALSYFTIKHTSVFAAHGDFAANRQFTDYLVPKIFRITSLLLFVLLAASPLLSHFLHFSSYLGFVVVGLATFFSTLSVVYYEILRGWQRFFLLSLIGLVAALAKFVSGAVLALGYHTAAAVSFSLLIASLFSWHLAKRWSRKKIINRKSAENHADSPASPRKASFAREALRAGWRDKYFSETNLRKSIANIFLFSLALILVSNLDVVLVKYFSSAETAGRYGAFALLGKIVLWLNLSVVSVLLPGACADGHAGKRPGKYQLLESYGLMAAIGLALIAAYYLLPGFIVNIFFGKKYLLETQILWLFGLMSLFLSILTLEANLSFAKRDFRVVYFLTATLVLMVAGLAKYHANLTEIVLSFSVAFLFGYLSITISNLMHEKKMPKISNS